MIQLTAALADLGATRDQMRELMRKWFAVDSMSEIDMYIREGAQVRYQIQRIFERMERDGKGMLNSGGSSIATTSKSVLDATRR